MIWLNEFGVFLATIGVLFIPGGIVAWALGLRSFTAVAAAFPFSMVALAVAALANVVVEFPWGVVPLLVSTAFLVGCAFAYRGIVARVRGDQRLWRQARIRMPYAWAPYAAVGAALALITVRLIWVFGDPTAISQTFDNIYHLNAVRHIIDTGQAAPTRQLIPGFYPSAWHSAVALVVQTTGTSIPIAVNVTSIALGAIAWPMGCVFLVRQIFGHRPPVLMAAGLLAAGVAAFPLLMLDFGVLYPNVLAIALLPFALGALLAVARLGAFALPSATAWALLLPWVVAVALAHPSTLMAFFAMGFWPAVAGGAAYFERRLTEAAPRGRLVAAGALWVVGSAAVTLLFIKARPTSGQAFWQPFTTPGEAILDVLTNSEMGAPMAIAASALMLCGVVAIVAWRRRHLWLVAAYATMSFVYIVGVSFPSSPFRYLLTGTWYSDMMRVTALMPVLVVPLAAFGFGALVALASRLLPAERSRRRRGAAIITTLGLLTVLVATQAGASLAAVTASARSAYSLREAAPLLSTDETALLMRLGDHVPADAVIVGSPWTGTSLSYALAERRALVPHIYQETDDDMATLLDRLRDADEDSDVCEALERTDVEYVLDFGSLEVHGAEHPYPGLARLEESGVVELVDSEGEARLYRITACGLGE
jgi:hypothetical protein